MQLVIPHSLMGHLEQHRDAAVLKGMRERLEDDFEATFPEDGTSVFGEPAGARAAFGTEVFAEAAAIGRATDLEQMASS